MDDSVSPDQASDTLSHSAELPVPVDTLAIGDAEPEIGDPVTFRVSGSVTRRVNQTAYVRIETVNDIPLKAPIVEPNDGVDEGDRLRQLSQMVDRSSL